MNAMLSLCEDAEPHVRLVAVRGLPVLVNVQPSQLAKVADILTTGLAAEDPNQMNACKSSLSQLWRLDFKASLDAAVTHIRSGEDKLTEKVPAYVVEKFDEHRGSLTADEGLQTHVVARLKELLTKSSLEAALFDLFYKLLRSLEATRGPKGVHHLEEVLASRAGIHEAGGFDINDEAKLVLFGACMLELVSLKADLSAFCSFVSDKVSAPTRRYHLLCHTLTRTLPCCCVLYPSRLVASSSHCVCRF
jgi:hypothetical protein